VAFPKTEILGKPPSKPGKLVKCPEGVYYSAGGMNRSVPNIGPSRIDSIHIGKIGIVLGRKRYYISLE
jgi:hypothetical protein